MKSSGIGGQAVIEGVMMKNGTACAVAVRRPDKKIEVKTDKTQSLREKHKAFKLPILRGIAAFIESLVLGMQTLTYSAGFYEDDDEKDKKPKTEKEIKAEKQKENIENVLVVIVSIILAVAIFMLLPFAISTLISKLIKSKTLIIAIECLLRILLFVLYIFAISKMNDIKRVFMYHGAEHKCINCIENGYDLSISNVRRSSKRHKRCGTSFLVVVLLVSFVFFIFIRTDILWLRYVLRILLIPVIAGVSFEFILYAGSHDNLFVRIFSAPGFLMQDMTTREPDDSMIEVGIASVAAVFDYKSYLADYRSGKLKDDKAGLSDYPVKESAGNKVITDIDEILNPKEYMFGSENVTDGAADDNNMSAGSKKDAMKTASDNKHQNNQKNQNGKKNQNGRNGQNNQKNKNGKNGQNSQNNLNGKNGQGNNSGNNKKNRNNNQENRNAQSNSVNKNSAAAPLNAAKSDAGQKLKLTLEMDSDNAGKTAGVTAATEEDEILKAFDKYFEYKGTKKTVTEMSGIPNPADDKEDKKNDGQH